MEETKEKEVSIIHEIEFRIACDPTGLQNAINRIGSPRDSVTQTSIHSW